MIVYDCTDRNTFEKSNAWLEETQVKMGQNAAKILVSNKCDLPKSVETEEGERYAQSKNVKFIEVSAKTGHNINEAFDYLIGEVIQQMDGSNQIQAEQQPAVLVARKAPKKSKCLLM